MQEGTIPVKSNVVSRHVGHLNYQCFPISYGQSGSWELIIHCNYPMSLAQPLH
jgi:hypothetical protein